MLQFSYSGETLRVWVIEGDPFVLHAPGFQTPEGTEQVGADMWRLQPGALYRAYQNVGGREDAVVFYINDDGEGRVLDGGGWIPTPCWRRTCWERIEQSDLCTS